MKKRLISILLTVLMIASVFPAVGLTAFADDQDVIQYTMKSGDTVIKICNGLGLNFATCQPAIKKLNNITSDAQYRRLTVGTVLKMPASNEAAARIMANSITGGNNSGSTGGNTVVGGNATNTPGASNAAAAYWLIPYTIQRGETLVGVCSALGISFSAYADQIKAINGIKDWNRIPAGKTLLLPSPSTPAAGTTCYKVIAHKVQSGDTAYDICNTYGISYTANTSLLQALNKGVSLTRIKAGSTLLVAVPSVVTSGTTGGTQPVPPTGGNTGGTQPVPPTGGNTGGSTGGTTTKAYSLSAKVSGSGSVSFTVGGKAVTSATAGSQVTVVAAPGSGAGLKNISLSFADGSAVPVLTDSTFTMPSCNVVVTASFDSGYYIGTISDHAVVKLSVNGVATNTAVAGSTVTVTATPDAGYRLGRIWVQENGGSYNTLVSNLANGGSFVMPKGKVFVRVDCEGAKTYDLIKVTNDLNGSFQLKVNGTEVNKASQGATVQIVPKPATGYQADKITVTSNGTNITCYNDQFAMPASDVTVTVTFKKAATSADIFKVEVANVNNGYAYAKNGDSIVNQAKQGAVITMEGHANDGYQIVKYEISSSDNGYYEVTPGNSFTMPAADVYIKPIIKASGAQIGEIKTNDSTIADISVSLANTGAQLSTGSNITVGDSIFVSVNVKKQGYDTKVMVYYKDINDVDQSMTVSANSSFTVPACKVLTIDVQHSAKVYQLTINSGDNGGFSYKLGEGSWVNYAGSNGKVVVDVPVGQKISFTCNAIGDTLAITEGSNMPSGNVDKQNNVITMPNGNSAVNVTVKHPAQSQTVMNGAANSVQPVDPFQMP